MSIRQFMEQNFDVIRNEIISELEDRFDSHDFICRFIRRFEVGYIGFLHEHGTTDAFRTINAEIGKFLSENKNGLFLCSLGKVQSRNVFGCDSEVEEWQKVK